MSTCLIEMTLQYRGALVADFSRPNATSPVAPLSRALKRSDAHELTKLLGPKSPMRPEPTGACKDRLDGARRRVSPGSLLGLVAG
jgi:hypothetical protein